MKWWKKLGTSTGTILLKPLDDEYFFWRSWLKDNYPDIHEKVIHESSPKQRALSNIFRILDIRQSDYYHNHRRGVYFCPLYENYREFLTDKIKEKDLVPIENNWYNWWKKKSKDRVKKLTEDNRLQTDILFHENITEEEINNWLSSRGVG